jgi:hypothetical protein
MKAYPERKCTLWDIQVVSPPNVDGRSQAPMGIIKCDAGTWENGYEVPLSISHDGGYATATALGYMGPVVDSTARAPPSSKPIPALTSSRSTSQSNGLQSWPLDELEDFCRIAGQHAETLRKLHDKVVLKRNRWVLVKSLREAKGPSQLSTAFSVSDLRGTTRPTTHLTRFFDLKPNVEREAGCRKLYELHSNLRDKESQVSVSVELFTGMFSDFQLKVGESPKDRAMMIKQGSSKGPIKWIPPSDLGTKDNVVNETTNGDLHKRKQLDKERVLREYSEDGSEHDNEERKLRDALEEFISRRKSASPVGKISNSLRQSL